MYKSWPIKSPGVELTSDQSWMINMPCLTPTLSCNIIVYFGSVGSDWLQVRYPILFQFTPVESMNSPMGWWEGIQGEDNPGYHLLSSMAHPGQLHACVGRTPAPAGSSEKILILLESQKKVISVGQLRWQVSQLQLCPLFTLLTVFGRSPTHSLDGMKSHKPSAVGGSHMLFYIDLLEVGEIFSQWSRAITKEIWRPQTIHERQSSRGESLRNCSRAGVCLETCSQICFHLLFHQSRHLYVTLE